MRAVSRRFHRARPSRPDRMWMMLCVPLTSKAMSFSPFVSAPKSKFEFTKNPTMPTSNSTAPNTSAYSCAGVRSAVPALFAVANAPPRAVVERAPARLEHDGCRRHGDHDAEPVHPCVMHLMHGALATPGCPG